MDSTKSKIVHLIAGARPNLMKVAPLFHALAKENWCRVVLVHTGQHYSEELSGTFFSDFSLPKPDYNLEVGSGSHGEQTAKILIAYEKLLIQERPDLVVVVGDVNSTLACCLAAKKLNIKVAHIEAGLRSRDWTMPEEINRLATDAISDHLFSPSIDASENLVKEGVPSQRLHLVGNIMIDAYVQLQEKIKKIQLYKKWGFSAKAYGVVTLHRPSNVDYRERLSTIIHTLLQSAVDLPLVFPVHPRTQKNLREFGLWAELHKVGSGIRVCEPLGYADFMSLVEEAKFVLTDSGGIQEETTYLGIPCLTLRDTTERPITITEGTNRLLSVDGLSQALAVASKQTTVKASCPALWDGKTADRVVRIFKEILLSP